MIADCETCDRKQVPCKSCQESQRAICYRCDGDVDDPYCEIEEMTDHRNIPRQGETNMSQTVKIDIPIAEVRARRSVILNLLEELNKHNSTTMQTVDAIDDLIRAAIAQAMEK